MRENMISQVAAWTRGRKYLIHACIESQNYWRTSKLKYIWIILISLRDALCCTKQVCSVAIFSEGRQSWNWGQHQKWKQPQNKGNHKMKMTSKWRRPENEDYSKNEDDLKNEDIYGPSLHNLGCACSIKKWSLTV